MALGSQALGSHAIFTSRSCLHALQRKGRLLTLVSARTGNSALPQWGQQYQGRLWIVLIIRNLLREQVGIFLLERFNIFAEFTKRWTQHFTCWRIQTTQTWIFFILLIPQFHVSVPQRLVLRGINWIIWMIFIHRHIPPTSCKQNDILGSSDTSFHGIPPYLCRFFLHQKERIFLYYKSL